jgi:hypothetical protein
MASDETQLAVIASELKRVMQDVQEIKTTVQSNYVTREEFRPIRIFVYGLITICLLGIGTAVIGLVVHK